MRCFRHEARAPRGLNKSHCEPLRVSDCSPSGSCGAGSPGRRQARPLVLARGAQHLVHRNCSLPFGYKAAVDGFELGDAGDELSALWALDFGTELKPQPLLQLVAVGSEPPDLLVCKCEIGSCGERRGAARIDPRKRFDDAEQPRRVRGRPGLHEPGRHSRRSSHGWEGDRLACCLKVLNGIERTSPLVTAVGSSGGHEGRGASGCHRQLPTATTGI